MPESRPEVIVIHAPEPAPLKRLPKKPRALRWPARSIGIAATVLLHVLLCSPLVLGTAAHKKKTPEGMGTTAWASQGEAVESMVLIDLSSMSPGPQLDLPKIDPAELAIELEREQQELRLLSAIPEPDVAIEDEVEEAEESPEAAGDPRGRAELFGKYMGQVAARIDRAWMRPRTPIAGGHFDCRARVVQDRQGFVLSVSLDGCGDDAKWRDSLSSAILRASPLSSPPEPSLFTAALTLQFAAEQYEAGRTPDYLYEPALVQLAMKTSSSTASGSASLSATSPASAIPPDGDVELTITGDKVEWKKR